MRFLFLIVTVAALGGCATHRDVTFVFYPNAPHRATFPRPSEFYAAADKECGKYGMVATHYWTTYADFDRVKVIYDCVQ